MPKSVYSEAHAALVDLLISTRKASGLLQSELAAKVGKDQSYISYIETGQRRVDVIEFYDLATAMKIDPAKLYAELVRRIG